jgi:hypothetical protein
VITYRPTAAGCDCVNNVDVGLNMQAVCHCVRLFHRREQALNMFEKKRKISPRASLGRSKNDGFSPKKVPDILSPRSQSVCFEPIPGYSLYSLIML